MQFIILGLLCLTSNGAFPNMFKKVTIHINIITVRHATRCYIASNASGKSGHIKIGHKMNIDTNSSVQFSHPLHFHMFLGRFPTAIFLVASKTPLSLGMEIIAPLSVQHFMEKANLPTFERKAINSSVLGALPLYSDESCDLRFWIFSVVFAKRTFLCQLPQLFDFLIQNCNNCISVCSDLRRLSSFQTWKCRQIC